MLLSYKSLISLVICLPRYFIIFDAIILLTSSHSLVCGNTTDFCMLILWPRNKLLDSLLVLRVCGGISKGFLEMWLCCLPAEAVQLLQCSVRETFRSSLLTRCSCLSATVLEWSREKLHLGFLLRLEEQLSAVAGVGLSFVALRLCGAFLQYLRCWDIWVMGRFWIVSDDFLCPCQWAYDFVPFIKILWYIKLINLFMVVLWGQIPLVAGISF